MKNSNSPRPLSASELEAVHGGMSHTEAALGVCAMGAMIATTGPAGVAAGLAACGGALIYAAYKEGLDAPPPPPPPPPLPDAVSLVGMDTGFSGQVDSFHSTAGDYY